MQFTVERERMFASFDDVIDISTVTMLEQCISACAKTAGCEQFVLAAPLDPDGQALDHICFTGHLSNATRWEPRSILYQLAY